MLTVTYRDLLQASPVLQELSASTTLAPALMLRVYRLVRAANPALEDLQKAQQAVLDQHTVRDEGGNPTPVIQNGAVVPGRVNITNAADLQEAIDALLGEPVEIHAAPLALKLFGLSDSLPVSAAALLSLGTLLSDDDNQHIDKSAS